MTDEPKFPEGHTQGGGEEITKEAYHGLFEAISNFKPVCPYYGKLCPSDGEECRGDDVCALEGGAEKDAAADRGDWKFHQEHDQ